jgi:hypothetical protein
MSEELGKIEKPLAENFKAGRKLYFVPLIFGRADLPLDITLKFSTFWDQVESQIANLEDKLGRVTHIMHEMVPEDGDAGLKDLEQVSPGSIAMVRSRVEKGCLFEPVEDPEVIAELMDWSRCLGLGLQSQKVFSAVYQQYTDANNKRNDFIAQKIDSLVKPSESCILIMGEGHHVKFPADFQVFYVAPPALDEIKRWLREHEQKPAKENPQEQST